MGWIDSLGGLPETVATLVVFVVCLILVIRSILKRVVDPLAKSNHETAEAIKQAIDTNTKAVEKAVDHNEKIITNHLSGQAARDEIILGEMRGVVTSIDTMNNRRRAGDS